ncbi:hypothetical protein [Streptomyces sp. V4I2]|uniref:hypothetical protein n=1 Tax=Streptomyces sp. V4I2 TaxID=3042280 RepID=UPI002780866A|nr:hypothetical protein [Streptomyces sp. V4I2]MDQ1042132.1 hypothetical protein [Streptomyces sp. V4I2]
MNTDYWAKLADSEREQWKYSPRHAVGPLKFGDAPDTAITLLASHGFSADLSEIERWSPQRAQWRAEFRRFGSDEQRPAFKAYFVDGVGLTCVLVDGLNGPQVTFEGIKLIGRVPTELDAEMEESATEKGFDIWYCPSGDLSWADFDFDRGAQRCGDQAVSWASFVKTGQIGDSSWDIAPAEVWRHW